MFPTHSVIGILLLEILEERQEVSDDGFSGQIRLSGDFPHGQLPVLGRPLGQHVPEQGSGILPARAVVAQVEGFGVGIFGIVLSRLFA